MTDSNGIVELQLKLRDRLQAIRLTSDVNLQALVQLLTGSDLVKLWHISINHERGPIVRLDGRTAEPGNWLVRSPSGDIDILTDDKVQDEFAITPPTVGRLIQLAFDPAVTVAGPWFCYPEEQPAKKKSADLRCPACAHPASVHSPAGCWHTKSVLRCSCTRLGLVSTAEAKATAQEMGDQP